MAEYRLFSERAYDRENGEYVTYGIEAYVSGEVIRTVGDISADKAAVSELVKLFNEGELSILHLDTAIEDFLYDSEV